jgi:hypothetical protein
MAANDYFKRPFIMRKENIEKGVDRSKTKSYDPVADFWWNFFQTIVFVAIFALFFLLYMFG